MKKLLLVALLLAFPISLTAADPKPKAGPVFPVLPTPAPVPVPVPASVSKLTGDRLYVVQSDEPYFLKVMPAGLVTVTSDEGPTTIWGRFVDSKTDRLERRKYTAKFVYVIQADRKASGRASLLFIPKGVQDEKDIVQASLDVEGEAPAPSDPLLTKLAETYAADGSPEADARALAAVFRQGVSLAGDTSVTTTSALLKILHASAERLLPLPKLGKTREAVARELDSKLPTRDAPLDAASRKLCADQFSRMATLLGGL